MTDETTGAAGAPETTLAEAEKPLFATVASKDAALKAFIEKSAPAELLATIEDGAKTLLMLIESVPEGVVHGWHSLGAEIRARI